MLAEKTAALFTKDWDHNLQDMQCMWYIFGLEPVSYTCYVNAQFARAVKSDVKLNFYKV